MATEWQAPPNADVILRASGGRKFHAHKLVLSLASSVFRDMFSVPQPQPTEPSQLPIVDVNDPPGALEMFLRIIHPTRTPLINDLGTVAAVLRLADKYDVRDVLDVHRDYLPSTYSSLLPIQIYAILCACGHEGEAGAAARRVSFASLKTLDSNPLLPLITTTQYQRLASFMTARDERMREIIRRHHGYIARSSGYSCNDNHHSIYSSTIVSTLQAAFEADPCVQVKEALGLVLNAPYTFPQCGGSCRYNVGGVRKYAERLLEELVEMAQNLSWEDPHKQQERVATPESEFDI
jgi:hypothetical protein